MPAIGFWPASDEIMKTWPPPWVEVGQRGPRQAEDGGEVGAEDRGPTARRWSRRRGEAADAGVVDQDLQAAVRRDRAAPRPGGEGGVAEVARHGDGVASRLPDLGDQGVELGRGAGHGGDLGPFAAEGQGDGAADAAPAPVTSAEAPRISMARSISACRLPPSECRARDRGIVACWRRTLSQSER